jgi:hypothetical protein
MRAAERSWGVAIPLMATMRALSAVMVAITACRRGGSGWGCCGEGRVSGTQCRHGGHQGKSPRCGAACHASKPSPLIPPCSIHITVPFTACGIGAAVRDPNQIAVRGKKVTSDALKVPFTAVHSSPWQGSLCQGEDIGARVHRRGDLAVPGESACLRARAGASPYRMLVLTGTRLRW